MELGFIGLGTMGVPMVLNPVKGASLSEVNARRAGSR